MLAELGEHIVIPVRGTTEDVKSNLIGYTLLLLKFPNLKMS